MGLFKIIKKLAKKKGWKLKNIKVSASEVGSLDAMPIVETQDKHTDISLMVNPEDWSISITTETDIDESLCVAKLEEVVGVGNGYIVQDYKDWLKWCLPYGQSDHFRIRLVEKDYSSKVYRVLKVLTHY